MQNSKNYKEKTGNYIPRLDAIRVGGARNAHGTRVARRITCVSCGTVDYTALGAGSAPRCRSCAKSELGAFEQSVKVPVPLRRVICYQCKLDCFLPQHIAQKEQALCGDCARGFELWQGSPGGRLSGGLEVRPSGAVLRRRSV